MAAEYDGLLELLHKCPIPDKELMYNLGLFIPRKKLAHILYIHELCKLAFKVPGYIMEFGTRWGQNLVLFKQLVGVYEPFNTNRRIIGFDTFQGFTGISKKDSPMATEGGYGVTEGYELYLQKVLSEHGKLGADNKMSCNVIKGDAPEELQGYLHRHSETIIALAYFDMDLYEPTKKCLELIKPYLTRGSVVAFDELNHASWPGETEALREVFGLGNVKLQRGMLSFSSPKSYMVIE